MYFDTFKMINGDIAIGKDLELVKGQEELRQSIENRLSININEWFLNTQLGLNYAEIEGKQIPDKDITLAIRECCFQDDRVKNVDVDIERNNAERTVNIKLVITDNNDADIELLEVIGLD